MTCSANCTPGGEAHRGGGAIVVLCWKERESGAMEGFKCKDF